VKARSPLLANSTENLPEKFGSYSKSHCFQIFDKEAEYVVILSKLLCAGGISGQGLFDRAQKIKLFCPATFNEEE
jgi:hypothetical protein